MDNQSCSGSVGKQRVCPEGRAYVNQKLTESPKKAIICCEGACIKGEVARGAANILAYQLQKENSVRICMGDAATGNSGMLELIERAPEVIAVEGCALQCGTEILRKRVPDQKITVVYASRFYPASWINSLEIFDTPEGEIKEQARNVAKEINERYFLNKATDSGNSDCTNSCCGN